MDAEDRNPTGNPARTHLPAGPSFAAGRAVKREIKFCENSSAFTVKVGQRELVNFASNDYLGLSLHDDVKNAALKAITEDGTGSTASPLICGSRILHQELVQAICKFKSCAEDSDSSASSYQTESWRDLDALVFPSGYSVNLGVCQSLFSGDDQIYCDRKVHASLIDGVRLAKQISGNLSDRYFKHRDYDHLERLLKESSSQSDEQSDENGSVNRWIVTDSVFSMDGTLADADRLLEIAKRYQAGLMVDEAHATGLLGEARSGLFSLKKAEEMGVEVISVGTFSKAIGTGGGFVVAGKQRVDSILQSARSFIFSTSLSPANAAAAKKSIEIIQSDQGRELAEKQLGLVELLRSGLIEQGWNVVGDIGAPLLGVVVGSAEKSEKLSDLLIESGYWAPAIRPPTVKPQECRIRISPTALMPNSVVYEFLDRMKTMVGME